ncbi:MAG: thioredoxin peroxidase 1 [Candidatus Xenolissoclinum pacificiensis L6]|uniref:Thioredoxin peroxidase n=1 Tax=Candidatus Xenolissoclinum pacificiensis L6 TaxID=1401685 RepID=W2V0D4_9RICK|nr:MAG: thioredoxin peroxidase 1 [Candidatus Xenolissoclinum pacificiensis L6]
MYNLITKRAIDFTAPAVLADGSIKENFNLQEETKGSYSVLFFYPFDFTFVCPTEIIEFSNMVSEFEKVGTKIIGCSTDSQFSHHAWRNTPVTEGGIGNISFPLVSDHRKEISGNYGVLVNDNCALRATIITDANFIVRHISINDLPVGRNVEEVLRLVKAFQYHEKHGDVCPVNWTNDKKSMIPTPDGVKEYLNS